jgi:type IVB pilus formation R64 PilN family outer membrane protein
LPGGFPNPQQGLQAPTGQITSASPLPVNYSGNLAGLMNLVASYYGISWKATSSGVVFFLLDTKTFRITSLPGDTKLSSNVESQSGGSSSGGGTGTGSTPTGSSLNSTGVKFENLSVWKATEDSIKQMLSRNGKVVASPAIGTVTVTDTPAVLAQVTEFIESQNVSLNRQVSINVRILSITLDDSDNYGINWDAVYSNLTDRSNPYSLALKTSFASATGSGNLILSSPSGTGNQFAGSSAIFSALSTQGKVSELTSSTLTTMNNQPAPVNVGRRISYAASSATTVTASAGSTTTLTPGSIQTGFSMTLVPHILDSRELLLQYSIDVSSLIALNTFTSSGSSIQTPDISTSNFIQRVRLRSGDTLVVAGFDQDNLSAVKGGIGSPDNVALGGRRQGNTKRTMLVVLVQPNLVQ